MAAHGSRARERADRLNESPSQKEGKLVLSLLLDDVFFASMKALPKRKGNPRCRGILRHHLRRASMKALPKRKGNEHHRYHCRWLCQPQ